MISPPSSLSGPLILIYLSLPCLFCIFIGAYALVCSHHKSLLELRLNTHRTNSLRMLLEKEIVTKAKDAEVSALRTENEELRGEVLCLKQMKEEVEGMMLEREVEFLEVEATWARERDELKCSSAQHATEMAQLTMSLHTMRVDCMSKDAEIRVLVQGKEHLEVTNTKHEEKILELTDKLSEYSRLTKTLSSNGTPDSSPLSALREREPPSIFSRALETQSATPSPTRRPRPPRQSPSKGAYV